MFGEPEARGITEKFLVFSVLQCGKFHKLISIVLIQTFGVSGPAGVFHAQIFQDFCGRSEIADASRIGVRVFFIKSQHGAAGFFMVHHTLSHSDSSFVKRIGTD